MSVNIPAIINAFQARVPSLEEYLRRGRFDSCLLLSPFPHGTVWIGRAGAQYGPTVIRAIKIRLRQGPQLPPRGWDPLAFIGMRRDLAGA